MVDSGDYSGEQSAFVINIGGLDSYDVRRKVIKIIEKLVKPYSPKYYEYTFTDIDNETVLLIKAETQFIPNLIKAFCKKNLAIYEVYSLDGTL